VNRFIAKSIFVSSVVCTMLVFMTSGVAQAANVAGNPSFEAAGGGGATDSDLWTEFAGGPAGTLSERDASMPFAGAWAHHLVAVGDATAGASAGINQNSIADVGLPSLEELTTVSADFYWKGDLGPGGVAFGVLRVLNGAGAIVADTGLVPLPDTGGVYTLQSLGSLPVPAFAGAPDDVYAAFLEVSVSAGAFDGSIAEGYVDQVRIDATLVPEPASLGLLLLAGVIGIRRR
jgi:hypothetical protein